MNVVSIKPRRIKPDTLKPIEKHWLSGSPFLSHLLNSFTLIFPDGERFFIRTIKKFSDTISNPELSEEINTFINQEGGHAILHQSLWRVLREQGYDIDLFIEVYYRICYEILEEQFGDKLSLSVSAGMEHLTTIFAELGLTMDLFQNADPVMGEIFEWHAAEELEHKAVVFDVLQDTDKNYFLRISGFLIAMIMVFTSSAAGTIMLLNQDNKLFVNEVLKDMAILFFGRDQALLKGLESVSEYFALDFHPANKNTFPLAAKIFQKLETKYGRAKVAV